MKSGEFTSNVIDEYISDFPDDVQKILQKVRKSIRQVAPDAQEKIN